MSEPSIEVTREGHVARVVINHPARRNAMTYAMWGAFADAFEALAADEQAWVVILTGAGDRAFCAGNDISEFGKWRTSKAMHERYDAEAGRAIRALETIEKPVIGRVRGSCVGGGFELAQLCDLLVAGDDARFGVTPARLGIGYKLEDTELLTRRIPARFVRELLFTGRLFDAEEALRRGFVNEVTPVDVLDRTVDELATTIAGNAPLSVRASKVIVEQSLRPESERDEARCQALVDACHASEDYAEGRKAFAEKRAPRFTGR